jgi:hypothetical protein
MGNLKKDSGKASCKNFTYQYWIVPPRQQQPSLSQKMGRKSLE